MKKRKQKKNFKKNFLMGSLSDAIEEYICHRIEESGGMVEMSRKDVVEHTGCIANHVSYILRTRFTPDKGYLCDSKKGVGSPYIRVRKLSPRHDGGIYNKLPEIIGRAITLNETRFLLNNLYKRGSLTHGEMEAIISAIIHQDTVCERDYAVTQYRTETMRAELLKSLLLVSRFE